MPFKTTKTLTGIKEYLDRDDEHFPDEDDDLSNIKLGLFSGNTAVTYPHPCRGYIMEAVFSFYYPKHVYATTKIGEGFKENKGFYVVSISGHISQHLDKILDLLHKIEDTLKFEHTKAVKTNHRQRDVYKFYCDQKWFHCPWLISFYNFVIRAMSYSHNTNDSLLDAIENFYQKSKAFVDGGFRDNFEGRAQDASDFVKAKDFLLKVLKFGIEPFFKTNEAENFPPSLYGIHEYGFRNISDSNYYSEHNVGEYEMQQYIHRFKNDEEISVWLLENGYDLPQDAPPPKAEVKKTTQKLEYSHWQLVDKSKKKTTVVKVKHNFKPTKNKSKTTV